MKILDEEFDELQERIDTFNSQFDEGSKSYASYDRDIVTGNRRRVNIALQSLDQAVRNLKRLDDKTLLSHVKDLRKAQDLIVAYNKKMSKAGYV